MGRRVTGLAKHEPCPLENGRMLSVCLCVGEQFVSNRTGDKDVLNGWVLTGEQRTHAPPHARDIESKITSWADALSMSVKAMEARGGHGLTVTVRYEEEDINVAPRTVRYVAGDFSPFLQTAVPKDRRWSRKRLKKRLRGPY